MDLQFEDVANLLHISANTLSKWMEKKNIPYYTISGKPRFNRQELEEWLMDAVANERELPSFETVDGSSTWNKFCLYRAIHKGCVIKATSKGSKEEIIKTVMQEAASVLKINPEIVAEMLIEREHLMSTALGGGIAVPHTRDFLLHDYTDAIVTVYLDEPMDWGAIDGTLTDTLIFLFACDDKRHLNLLAKIAHLTMIEETKNLFGSRPSKEKLLEEILDYEKSLQEGGMVTIS
jgi:PTS system nitrogen regulatory IIA component